MVSVSFFVRYQSFLFRLNKTKNLKYKRLSQLILKVICLEKCHLETTHKKLHLLRTHKILTWLNYQQNSIKPIKNPNQSQSLLMSIESKY
jgi:hypothetical protein